MTLSSFINLCRGLSTILASGNITTYPPLCAKVTASFSVLSDTINAVKSTLEKVHGRKNIATVISQLQKSEGEKLNLTAALHLERLRLRNLQLDVGEGGRGGGGSDDRTVRLLKDGIQTLEQKISGVVEAINEVLEELRCIAADENECITNRKTRKVVCHSHRIYSHLLMQQHPYNICYTYNNRRGVRCTSQ